MKRRAWIAGTAAVIGGLSIAGTAGGFGTVNGLGQHSEHEKITRAALACGATGAPQTCFQPKSINNLAGGIGTYFGAVGAPDTDEIFDGTAHCDNGDYFTVRAYPQTRFEAHRALLACRAHLQARFREAVTAADSMLSGRHLDRDGLDLDSACVFFLRVSGRSKCNVLDGLGRALHGTEDFYSHSNWADSADTSKPVSESNPPGMASTGVVPLMDFRAASVTVPNGVISGCFGLCAFRVTHGTLNKDEGIIDPKTGATRDPDTSRGKIGDNFQRAVTGAIAEARRQWDDLSIEIMDTYGTPSGNQIICGLTHDTPATDCSGKRLVIVGGGPGATAAADALNRTLMPVASERLGDVADQSASITLEAAPRVLSPLGATSRTSFTGFDGAGGVDPAAGIQAAIRELTKDAKTDPRGRGGIVLIGDGQNGSQAMLDALQDAGRRGIRVNVGLLSPAPEQPVRRPNYVSTVISLGGSVAVIDSAAARAKFVEFVSRNGLTANDDPRGRPAGGALLSGLTTSGLAATFPRTWTHSASAGIGITALRIQSDPGTQLSAVVRDARTLAVLYTGKSGADGVIAQRGIAFSDAIRLEITSPSGTVIPYTVRVDDNLPLANLGTALPDVIVDETGTKNLSGGEGDDVFAISATSVPSGVEQLDGGPGNDTVVFLIDRPAGVTCASTEVPVGKGRVALTNVEKVQYNYAPCDAPLIPAPKPAALRPAGAKVPSATPPRPTVTASATSKALIVKVKVKASTTISVATKVGKTVLEPLTRVAPKAGEQRFKVALGKRASGTATVEVTTLGVAGGPTKTATTKVTLK